VDAGCGLASAVVELPRRPVDRVVATLALAASAPSLVAGVEAVASGWRPIGDAALIELRALDVFSRHHPLLGTYASSSINGEAANHPGPLMFDLVAVPARFGGGGVAVALALLGAVMAVVSVMLAARTGGRRWAAMVAAAFVWVSWSVGTATLVDPFNPRSTMLVALAFLVAVPSVLALDRFALGWFVGCGSLMCQVHLGAAPFVVLVAGATAVLVIVPRRAELPRLVATAGRVAVPVAVVLWMQPIVEVLVHRGDSNPFRLLAGGTGGAGRNGVRLGTQVLSDVVIGPLPLARSTFDKQVFGPWPSFAWAVISVLALIGALVWSLVAARRHGDAVIQRTALAALVAIGAAWFIAVAMPISIVFGFTIDYLRLLWPVGALAWSVIVASVIAAVARRAPAGELTLRWRQPAVVAVVAVGAVTASVPATLGSEQRRAERAIDAADALAAAVLPALPPGAVRYAPPVGYDQFGPALLVDLVRDGRSFVVSDPVLVRQFGDRRRSESIAGVPELRVVVGLDALARRNDACVIGVGSSLDAAEIERLDAVLAEVAGEIAAGRWALGDEGRAIAATALAPDWFTSVGQPFEPAAVLAWDATLHRLVADGAVVFTALDTAAIQRDASTLADLDVLLAAAGLDC
jgi:hypothetical protein